MCCTVWPMTIQQRAFLESIRWADSVYGGNTLVVDIDFDHFAVSVLGADADVMRYTNKVRSLFHQCAEQIERKETEHYG